MKKLLLVVCMVGCWITLATAQSYNYMPTDMDKSDETERVIDFHADIDIQTDGNIVVTEYITVYAAGIDIKRGIIRNIPEYRVDKYDNKQTTPVKVRGLSRNGKKSGYHSEQVNGEIEIYFGSSDVLLEKGIHQYELVYETRRQVGFFDDFDELYWDATGFEWEFAFDRVSVTVHMPGESEAIKWACYTGKYRSVEKACDCNGDKSAPVFKTTRRLLPGENLSVAVAFPRDIIQRPTKYEQFKHVYRDWISGIIIILTTLLTLFLVWIKVKRGAPNQLVIPQFAPYNNWTPAITRFAYKRHFDDKVFTVALLQMAVKGAIGIEYRKTRSNRKSYFLIPKNEQNLTEEEKHIFECLFVTSENGNRSLKEIQVGISNRSYFEKAMKSFKEDSVKQLSVSELNNDNAGNKGCSIFLIVIFCAVYSLVSNPEVLPMLVVFSALIATYFVFNRNTQTEHGAKVKAYLAGFRMYLGTTEKRWLNQLTPPEQTPEHFEEMLPYAVALDVGNKWCKKFDDTLIKCNYKPEWYVDGNYSNAALSGIVASNFVREFGRTVTSSSTSSSSSGSSDWSSGSDGGGYSGGGGGGGGGRGW